MTDPAVVWPKKTREYEDMDADSRRWNEFKFRDGDIVIDTLGKSGTTLMQQMVGQLIFEGRDELFANPIAPEQWLDLRIKPLKKVLELLEAQAHRRCIKTHLPIDALVFSRKAKYIYVGRDMRDILWSWYNVITFTLKEPQNPPSLPLLPKLGVREFYLHVADYAPMWNHVKDWWAFRHLPNVLFVHFNNLKADLGAEICRVARFLDIALDEAKLPQMIEHCGLDYMREKMAAGDPNSSGFASNFFHHKGTNGRWRDVLSLAETALADEAAAKYLSSDCAHWLKTGKLPETG